MSFEEKEVLNDGEIEFYKDVDKQGVIMTSSNTFGQDAFYPLPQMYAVRFLCRPAASIATLCTCKTEVSTVWHAASGMASIFTNIELDVILAYSGSGVCATLYFGTMDSNGGTATWKALCR